MTHANDLADIADFLLYPGDENPIYSYHQYPQRHTATSSGELIYGSQPAVASEDGTFTGLLNGDNSTIESLHSQTGTGDNKSITSHFFSDSSEEPTGYQSQSYILPTTSAEYHYAATYGIPRTLGPFDPSLPSTPGFILHPPTIPLALQLPSHSEKSDYRSTPSASPATSVGGFEGLGSGATHSSINSAIGSNASVPSSVRGSPFITHEDPWSGTLPEKVESLGISAGWSDGSGCVDPRILDPSPRESPLEDPTSRSNSPFNPPNSPHTSSEPASPSLSRKKTPVSRRPSPFSNSRTAPYPLTRRDSIGSGRSSKSPRLEYLDDTMAKNRPPSSPTAGNGTGRDSLCQECGKTFRDLRAHQLTHQQERPEKCPIATCEYSKKGFARKYDCQRHTLTHYKGTMVCGFCPGSGSAGEKSFNRADVFKRHLMTVHHVEQTPPNGRKKTSGSTCIHPSLSPSKSDEKFTFGLTGKCSTCSVTFATAQQFYEHLDDCVLNKVVQEEPNAAYNEMNLDQVKIEEMAESLARTSVRGRRTKQGIEEPEEEEDEDEELGDLEEDLEDKSDEKDETWSMGRKNLRPSTGLGRTPSTRARTAAAAAKIKRGPASSRYKNGSIQKPRARRGGKKRKNFPAGWGCQAEQMVTKRRCLMVFDGPNILCRDEMMMHTEWEVKANSGGDAYVSDLDFWTMQRANAALDAAPSNVEVH